MSRNSDILFTAEYIQNVLYFAVIRPGKILQSTEATHYFCTDEELMYDNYYSDFGPLNLGCVYRFCKILNDKLKRHLNIQAIVYYTINDPKKKANAAFLMSCFGVLYLNLLPRDALKPLTFEGHTYKPFQDATPGDSPYTITILDCLNAVKRAREVGFFNFQDFDLEDYERLDRIQGGDLNWIVPGKFLAFIGPVDLSFTLYHPPEMYINYFTENNVKIVIRLNKRQYDANVFSNAGIMHYDLFFPDGTCPPRHILLKFLQISEEANCAIAVHCKAGLGRTGSLIGSYLIKHYRMTAHEAIAWMRICRPGSVIGQQQGWLEQMEPWLLKQGIFYRKRNHQDPDKIPVHEYGIYSKAIRLARTGGFVYSKSPSPPPPMQRPTRSEITSPARPNASKAREAAKKKPNDYHVITSKNHINNIISQESQNSNQVPRQGAGSGDPRPIRTPTHSGTPSTQKRRESNSSTSDHPIRVPTFGAGQVSMLKTVKDAKDFLMRSNMYGQEREKQYRTYNISLALPNSITPENMIHPDINTGSKPSNNRKKLGRSPSPPLIRGPLEQTRATNTAPEKRNTITSKLSFADALARLKLSPPRDNSIGAASLGAQREAPTSKRAPSVRSDERPTATQGDMLNSIKLQRRMWHTYKNDNITHSHLDRISQANKERSCINSKTSMPNRTTADISSTRVMNSNKYMNPKAYRPISPKGRRS